MTKNILLIEDMDYVADLYIETMEMDGRFKVTHCKNHIDAEALLSTNKILLPLFQMVILVLIISPVNLMMELIPMW